MSTTLVPRNGNNQAIDLPSQDVAHSITSALEGLKAIRTFIKDEFKKGIDFGKIPGCGDKDTLLLPGAQKATMFFNAYPTFKVREKDLGGGHITYTLRCQLVSRVTREIIGEGVGCCSTMEKKYRWRGSERKCPACGKPTIRKSKDKPEWYCWRKIDGCGATFKLNHSEITSQGDGSPVENPDLYDLHNTILKMAKKRSHVDAAMTLGCLSELFTQDIEDFYPMEAVKDAAKPYDGEVIDVEPEYEPEPVEDPGPKPTRSAGGPKHPNNSGFDVGRMASPEQTKFYLERLNLAVDEANGNWADFWQNPKDGSMPIEVRPTFINKFAVDGHLLKWAIETGQIDQDARDRGDKQSTLGRFVAILVNRDTATAKAVKREMNDYITKIFHDSKETIYRNYPHLAPDGWFEEQQEALCDKGDAYLEPEEVVS